MWRIRKKFFKDRFSAFTITRPTQQIPNPPAYKLQVFYGTPKAAFRDQYATNNGKVIFGATVVLVNTDTDEEVTYQIVGDDEADIKSGLISVNSPIARGLVGKELDDTVNITTPGGTVEFEIIEVNYI